ncbi:hypothetical protein [Acetonema longum]|uniref:Uncharacterized protein n=1 Tax=Acetonema longum DSM 6540 TaxID=1009370 RepID=F7NDR7_9FIRM|nr:hypothetical protein [Acetonema longum]EGO65836.1 hypothetical protein ALO_00870 [Acetonema longum DSM 6540]
MTEQFSHLLQRIADGECLNGTYRRQAVSGDGAIRFDETVVRTYGGTLYTTTDPKENDRFFKLVDYQGCGVNSCYSQADHCNLYESTGTWQSMSLSH